MLIPDHSYSRPRPITVKFMARSIVEGTSVERWLRQFPGNIPEWGNCRFEFDQDATDYDWLAVYHDIPRPKRSWAIEKLNCPPEKTILITTEPSTITVYGTDYLRQYGVVLTSQEAWAVSHPNCVFCQPGLIWYYGFPFEEGQIRTYSDMQQAPPPEKSKVISTVCSSRQGKLTLHYKRFGFTQRLKEVLPELDVFGHGVNPFSDKADVIDPYQYHITIENHIYPHHMTEKLPDIFLGYGVPFYYGCPNAADYYPPESFISIDINDLERSLDIIKSTIANNEYKDRLPYVIEARRRVLEEHNLFSLLDRVIQEKNTEYIASPVNRGMIMNRQTLRLKRPLTGIRSVVEKVVTKTQHKFG